MQRGIMLPLVVSVFCAVLGSVQTGFHMGNLNSLHSIVESFYAEVWWGRYEQRITQRTFTILWAVTVGILHLAAALSSGFAWKMAYCYGRRKSILLANAFSLAGALLMGTCNIFSSFEFLIAGRLMMGIYCGLTMTIIPLYIQEVSPVNLRGALTAMNNVAVACGLLIGQVLSAEDAMGTGRLWTRMLTVSAVPAVLQLVTFPWCPKSPRQLFMVDKKEEDAVKALLKLRGTSEVWMEVERLNRELSEMEPKVTLPHLLSKFRKPLSIAVITSCTTHMCSFNAVINYSAKPLLYAGFSRAQDIALGIGFVNILSIIICAILVETVGRKRLLVFGQVTLALLNFQMMVSEASLTDLSWMKYTLAVTMFLSVCSYQIGPGTISAFIAADLFPPALRPMALGVTNSCSWFTRFLVAVSFQAIEDSMGPYKSLIFFAVLMSAAFCTIFCLDDDKEKMEGNT